MSLKLKSIHEHTLRYCLVQLCRGSLMEGQKRVMSYMFGLTNRGENPNGEEILITVFSILKLI